MTKVYKLTLKNMSHIHTPRDMHYRAESGASLIMVMLILVIVSLLGVGGAQIALMSERGARNDRDQQIAWQAAEAALNDAEFDMIDPVSTRQALFNGKPSSSFLPGCSTSGLCDVTITGKPAWLTVDFTSTSNSARTTQYGTSSVSTTNVRTFAAGGVGIQPAQAPRYIIELVPDTIGDKSEPTFLYRVTAMGFGPRTDIQAMVQMLYRK